MPYKLAFTPPERLVTIDVFGRMGAQDFLDAYDEAFSDPAWRVGFSALWVVHPSADFSPVTVNGVLNTLLPGIQRLQPRWGPDFKAAWLFADKETERLFRFWTLIPWVDRSGYVRVFDTMEDARDWLAVPRLVH